MDKLELDARVARLERRFGLLIVALLIVPAALLLFTIARGGQEEVATAATITAAPLPPPTPTRWVTPAPDPFSADMAMMGGMMASPDSMGARFHELSTLAQLVGEEVITQEEWEAKKAQILEKQLTPADLRSDLQMVQQLFDSGAISEEERSALRSRILGLDEPGPGEGQDH